MALEMGMNLVCSVLEQVVMCVCQYLFMSANAQTIHRKKSGIFWIYCAWRKCLRCGISDRADRESVDRCTDPADRGAASWNFIVSQKIGSLLLDLL